MSGRDPAVNLPSPPHDRKADDAERLKKGEGFRHISEHVAKIVAKVEAGRK